MKILFLAYHYKPDGGPAGPLNCMLAESLVNLGHEVTSISAVPHYPSGYVKKEYRCWKTTRNFENGVRVIRVPIPSLDRNLFLNRFIQMIFYQVFATIEGLKTHPNVFITTTPAFYTLLPSLIHGFKKSQMTIYSISDVYPDVGIRMEIFRFRFIIAIVTQLEKLFIRKSNKIRVVSKSFFNRIVELGAEENKISLIYDWVELDALKPCDKNNSFSNEFQLTNSFNIFYTGNIGHIQGLTTVIESANLLKNYPALKFVFVGDGNAKHDLQSLSDSYGLKNILFLPYQPREIMAQILGAANIGLVCLKKGIGFGALPSKTYSILSSGTPLIACVDEGSDTWDLVTRSGGGVAVPPENPESLTKAILDIYNDKEKYIAMCRDGRNYVINNHSPELAAKFFEQLFTNSPS